MFNFIFELENRRALCYIFPNVRLDVFNCLMLDTLKSLRACCFVMGTHVANAPSFGFDNFRNMSLEQPVSHNRPNKPPCTSAIVVYLVKYVSENMLIDFGIELDNLDTFENRFFGIKHRRHSFTHSPFTHRTVVFSRPT